MGEIEDSVGCMIKSDLTSVTLYISQPHIINKMAKGFNEDVKSLITFNSPSIPHKGIVRNQQTDAIIL